MSIQLLKTSDGAMSRDRYNNITGYEVNYLVIGAENPAAALDEVYNKAEKAVGNFAYDGCRYDGAEGEGIRVTAAYKSAAANTSGGAMQENQVTSSFDCSVSGVKIVRSIQTIAKYPATAKDAGGFIGWDGKTKDVEGCEVLAPTMRKTFTKLIRRSALNAAWERRMFTVVRHVNSKKFKGWEPGEVLFIGCSYSGSDESGELILVNFNFAIAPNESNVEITPDIVISKKDGWHYVWAMPDDTIQTVADAKQLKKTVIGAYVEQVYKTADFGILGLGDSVIGPAQMPQSNPR